jgi:hypothetical protein
MIEEEMLVDTEYGGILLDHHGKEFPFPFCTMCHRLGEVTKRSRRLAHRSCNVSLRSTIFIQCMSAMKNGIEPDSKRIHENQGKMLTLRR